VPKKSLTGGSSERVDTRVLPVIFRFTNEASHKTYVGQQVDIFIEE
jgi:HlyD family secretion protein